MAPTRQRVARFLILAAVILGTLWDASAPPASQWATRGAVGAIHLYQHYAAPLVSRTGVQCRFTPTCSHYAEAVIQRDGVWRGGWKAAGRILRCGPWTPLGTVDQP